ncbi:MAG: hypothetical protein J6S67_01175 [Methanobrevibacter sp.]|nr:hypothetical protein [Methanobrevibacter sp.]
MKRMFTNKQIKDLAIQAANEGIESGSVNANKKLYLHIITASNEEAQEGDINGIDLEIVSTRSTPYTQFNAIPLYEEGEVVSINKVIAYINDENSPTYTIPFFALDTNMFTGINITEPSVTYPIVEQWSYDPELFSIEDEVLAIN